MDALPIPPVLAEANLSLRIRQTTQKFHRDLPLSQVWDYNGGGYSGYLGPTLVARRGTPTTVSYVNRLPTTHLLHVDPTIVQMNGEPDTRTRTLTHLHGGHISAAADGNPYATPGEFVPGQTQRVTYANDQQAAHLWYHDHALGITRLNVMAGLAGHYLLRDGVDNGRGGNFPDEPGRGLPYGNYEIPLAIQDLHQPGTARLPRPLDS